MRRNVVTAVMRMMVDDERRFLSLLGMESSRKGDESEEDERGGMVGVTWTEGRGRAEATVVEEESGIGGGTVGEERGDEGSGVWVGEVEVDRVLVEKWGYWRTYGRISYSTG